MISVEIEGFISNVLFNRPVKESAKITIRMIKSSWASVGDVSKIL